MIKFSRKTYNIVMALVLIAVAAFGVWYVLSRSDNPSGELPVVRYVNFKVYDAVYVGIEKGFYEDEGIDVQIVGDVLAGPTGIQAVSSGVAEAGLSSIPAIINANLAGLPVVGVTDCQSALSNQPLEYYYSLCEDGITSVKDMAGKTAAVNLWYSSFHYTLIMELERNGMQEGDLAYSLISFPNQLPALLSGEVDMIALMEPYASQAMDVAGDQLCEVFNANDTFGEKQFTLHFLNRIWAEENPEQAKAFVMGTVRAINWIEANQGEAKQIISDYTGIPVESVPEYHYQKDGKVIMEDVQFWFDYLKNRDDDPARFWMDVSTIATNDYRE